MTLQSTWEDLDCKLEEEILETLKLDLDFKNVMPVQKAVVPVFRKNYDVAVEAATGSGKTLAFLVPIINNYLVQYRSVEDKESSEVFCLIISPTRELAIQIYDVSLFFQKRLKNFELTCKYGGQSNEIKSSGEGPKIIIATPGTINDIIKESRESRKFIFNSLQYLVLDEADRLLDSNFHQEVKEIILGLPKQRRTGLFSATLTSKKVENLIKAGLRNPVMIKLSVI